MEVVVQAARTTSGSWGAASVHWARQAVSEVLFRGGGPSIAEIRANATASNNNSYS
jgi:hypothetical protein